MTLHAAQSARSIALEAGPSADVTFLFSDIEGSTVRWERNPEAMYGALRRHDALLRDCIENAGGRVFKTIGDAFCAAFRNAGDAVGAALAAQRALAAEDFSAVEGVAVRMAVHCGTAQERDGDYFGPPVNRVARLLAIAHGGQVVLSESAARSLGAPLRPLELRDLGSHRLKDLIEPERVFGVVAPGLRGDFPPLASLSHFANNLPQQLTSLIGREAEVVAVRGLLASGRLATVVGAGGIGKTRVALQAGADLLENFPDGVWFVDLAPHGSEADVVAEIAAVFGIRERPDVRLESAVLAYLKRKTALLIFDNCEHLVEEAARVVASILRACPHVWVVAATREALGLAGEQVYRLPSLAVPPANVQSNAAAMLAYGAVQLFAERAIAVNGTFRLDDATAMVVGDIVRRLDGIALAVELAAARMKALSPVQLAAKLDERFRLLAGGNRGALPRQQTMLATIAWSYDLLDERERSVFRRLTVFSNGFTLEAAVATCAEASGDATQVADILAALVDKSLVVFDTNDPPRYRLLESIRQYGLLRLQEAGEATDAARGHATYFAEFARRADAAWDRTPDLLWYADVERELENVRAALEWTLETGHAPLVGAALAAALRPFWSVKAPVEGRRWLALARASVDPAGEPSLAAAIGIGLAATAPGRTPELLTGLEASLRIYRRLGDERGLARALVFYGDTLAWLGRLDEGERALCEALVIHRRRGDDQLIATDLCALAVLERIRGDLARSRELFASALTLFELVQSTRGRAAVLANLADLECASGSVLRSVTLAREAQSAYRLLRDRARAAQLDCSLAGFNLALDRYDDARTCARLALQPLRDVNDDSLLALALYYVAVASGFAGDVGRAARLLAYAEKQFRSLPLGRGVIEPNVHDRIVALLGERCDKAELARRSAEGEALTEDRAIEEALS